MEAIAEAQRHQGGGQLSVLCWGTSLTTAIDTPGFLAEHAQELVGLLLDTLPDCGARSRQRAVHRWVCAALAAPHPSDAAAFLQALAAAVAQQAGAAKGGLTPQAAFTLLGWCCLLIKALPRDGSSSSKAAAKLIGVQAALLDVVFDSSARSPPDTRRLWRASERLVLRLLRTQPELLPHYLAAAAASGSPGLVRAVSRATVQQQQQQDQQQRQATVDALLPVLCDSVLAGRAQPPRQLLAAYAPLLGGLSPNELRDKLLPAATRAMRRMPEPAMAALAGALAHVSADLSADAPELAALLLQQLRAKEAVRPSAEAALAGLGARVADGAVGAQLVQTVCSLLGGTSAEGKVKVAAERAALAAALAALATLPAGAGDAPASAAASFCSTFYKEERELGWVGCRQADVARLLECVHASLA
jgi:hypothetical protein